MHFSFVERVRLLFGAITKRICIEGWRCADREARFMRYSSVADKGACRVWKYGFVEERASNQTVFVHEYIAVIDTALFRGIAEKECRIMHAKHMNNFPHVFKEHKPDSAAAASAAADAKPASSDASALVLPVAEVKAATAASFA